MLHDTDLSQLDLNLLVLFDAVIAERHVGRTAKRLHLSPSAVSHGLARLRRMLRDPLFLKHPKGVVPTERATELSAAIADILQRVRSVVSTAHVFDARQSSRRFTIGAPDAVFPVVLPPLLSRLAKVAPNVDLAMRTILPQVALEALEAREVDVVIQPIARAPSRFLSTRLYDEEFAIAMRKGHPLGAKLTLAQYCAASHVLVSMTGHAHGNVDVELEKLGRSRRVAATVPSFMSALVLVGSTDLLAAVPTRARAYASRFGIVLVNPPAPLAPLGRGALNLIATRSAMSDAGIAWLTSTIAGCMATAAPHSLDSASR